MLGASIIIVFPIVASLYYLLARIGRGLSHTEAVKDIISLYHKGQALRED